MLSPGVKLCRDVVSQFCRLRCHRTLVLNLQCPPSSIVLRRVSTPTGEGKGLFEKENIVTIPNVLSLGRIVLSPALGYLVVTGNFTVACGLFVVASLSDMADGYIARNFKGQSSMLGSVLDPLADKCLVSVLCITLSFAKLIPIPLAMIILGKDMLLVVCSFYLRYITVPPPVTWCRYWNIHRSTVQVTPTMLGKVNTFLQLGLMALSLGAPVVGMAGHSVLQVLWYLTSVTTIGSGVQYLYQMRGFKILEKKPP